MTYLPPYDRRCQSRLSPWYRCVKEGTHWFEWPGCPCAESSADTTECTDKCEESWWECDGPHIYEELIVGEPPIRER